MILRVLAAAVLLAAGLFSLDARCATTARVVDMDPAQPAVLGRDQNFYVRIAYATDEPVALWARPFRNGSEVEDAISNASTEHSGTGEALGWFALRTAGAVDEVRVRAGGGKPFHEWEVARLAVQLRWSAAPAAQSSRAPWVDRLVASEQAEIRAQAAARASESASPGGIALFGGFMLLVLALLTAGIVIPLRSVWKWRGGWRLAAAAPAALIGFVVLRIVVDTARDPTSHNLWPFEILQFGTVALLAIGMMTLVRRWLGVEDARS